MASNMLSTKAVTDYNKTKQNKKLVFKKFSFYRFIEKKQKLFCVCLPLTKSVFLRKISYQKIIFWEADPNNFSFEAGFRLFSERLIEKLLKVIILFWKKKKDFFHELNWSKRALNCLSKQSLNALFGMCDKFQLSFIFYFVDDNKNVFFLG